MEYEIDTESRLFDDSTNPSLKREDKQPQPNRSSLRAGSHLFAERVMQTAVAIPEEEQRPA